LRRDAQGQRPALPPAGWYPDPAEPGRQRYWEGAHWTANQR
jgi:hypothetical protein